MSIREAAVAKFTAELEEAADHFVASVSYIPLDPDTAAKVRRAYLSGALGMATRLGHVGRPSQLVDSVEWARAAAFELTRPSKHRRPTGDEPDGR